MEVKSKSNTDCNTINQDNVYSSSLKNCEKGYSINIITFLFV